MLFVLFTGTSVLHWFWIACYTYHWCPQLLPIREHCEAKPLGSFLVSPDTGIAECSSLYAALSARQMTRPRTCPLRHIISIIIIVIIIIIITSITILSLLLLLPLSLSLLYKHYGYHYYYYYYYYQLLLLWFICLIPVITDADDLPADILQNTI